MISVTDLRAGTVFEDKGSIFQVLSYEHVKMGRGSANIKLKVKNVRTGATTEKNFISGARVKPVYVLKRDAQYLYKDNDFVYFMNPKTFEQINMRLDLAEGYIFLKEGENFSISFLEDEPLSLNLPSKMEFIISETGPSFKGNSATNVFKDAILENGLKTKVPPFIKIGDRVRIDTRTGEYTEKA
ncbi:MAG: elongation factor P [Candidatus Levyibacteriota bacterium]